MEQEKTYKNEMCFYYFTLTVTAWLPVFQEDRYCLMVIDSFNYCQKYQGLYLLGYVIMPTHIHMIISHRHDAFLFSVLRDFKQHTSNMIIELLEKDQRILYLNIFEKAAFNLPEQQYRIWKNNLHPVGLTSEKWLHEKLYYMHENPVRQGFVELPEYWKYSSARNWMLHDDRIIRVDKEVLGIRTEPSPLLVADIGQRTDRITTTLK